LGSILACIKPVQRKNNPAAQKPDAAAKEAAPSTPEASATPPKEEDKDNTPGQLVEVSMSTTERLCEQGQASACVASGRQAIARAEDDPQQLSRAAMFLHQACDMGISEACYDYALMVWQRSGAAYNAEEIRFAFELARRHGSAHATIPYDGLLDAQAQLKALAWGDRGQLRGQDELVCDIELGRAREQRRLGGVLQRGDAIDLAILSGHDHIVERAGGLPFIDRDGVKGAI